MHHLVEESGKSGTLQPHLRLPTAELQLAAHFLLLIQNGLQKSASSHQSSRFKIRGLVDGNHGNPPLAACRSALSFRLIKDGVTLRSNLRVIQEESGMNGEKRSCAHSFYALSIKSVISRASPWQQSGGNMFGVAHTWDLTSVLPDYAGSTTGSRFSLVSIVPASSLLSLLLPSAFVSSSFTQPSIIKTPLPLPS